MNVELVSSTGTWPPAMPFNMSVLADDGAHARLFNENSPEVILVATHDDSRQAQTARWIIPILFPSLEKAREAGDLLAATFEKVRELSHMPPPPCEDHLLSAQRFSRQTPSRAICVRCGHDAGEIEVES